MKKIIFLSFTLVVVVLTNTLLLDRIHTQTYARKNNSEQTPDGLMTTDVLYFTASVYGSSVNLNWESSSEIFILGYNVYEYNNRNGKNKTKINADIIPAQYPGSPYGSIYEFQDASPAKFYWLEVIGLNGSSYFIGPVEDLP